MYFGSVRFFKHVFLSILLLMIIVPTTLSVYFGTQLSKVQSELSELNLTLKEQSAQLLVSEDDVDGDIRVVNELQPQNISARPITSNDISYQELHSEFYCDPPTTMPERPDKVYLTFDDGPSKITPKFLDLLSEKKVKATFFVVSSQIDSPEKEDILRRIVAEGHTIAMHSHTHDYATIYQSVEGFLDDFSKCFDKIYEITGVKPTIFRFPGGSINSYNAPVYQAIITEMTRRGFTYFDWNVSAQDATYVNPPSPETIANQVVSAALQNKRSVVLMHDSQGKENTLKAVSLIIDRLSAEGKEFAALDQSVRSLFFGYR